MNQTIDIESNPEAETPNTMAVATRAGMAVGQALTVEQLHERLDFIRDVMKREMKEGQDFGKIPGTGDKPSLLQPGAQKLLMTFNLREQIKKEVLREIPHAIYGHREYEFTVVVFPAGLKAEDGWDGVGTCSTMESKYRYRKATRKCPKCGAEAIIEEKAEYVKNREPGWVCWKKKNGCGELFHKSHDDIVKQSLDDVENEDPADVWNTVRKMAFKRALVAAAINATNTSELWTADLEDMAENKGRQKAQAGPMTSADRFSRAANTRPAAPAPASPKTITPQQAIFADATTRERMIAQLQDSIGLATEYFQKAGCILETERLEDLPLQFVPVTKRQFQALQRALLMFGNGEQAFLPYAPNPEPPAQPTPAKPPETKAAKVEAPSVAAAKAKDPQWFWSVIISVPRKGMKKTEYDKSPDTIGSLYNAMKDGDKEAQSRLWGLVHHWDAVPREVNGKTYQPSEADKVCREALDAFAAFEEKRADQNQPESYPEQSEVPF